MNTGNINASQNTDVVERAILLLKQLMSRNISIIAVIFTCTVSLLLINNDLEVDN